MRRFLISALSLILVLISCEKELTPIQNDKEGTCSLEQFSILLSRAVYAEPELRNFIKAEALKRIDYDTDVFYPIVKDVLIDGQRTFEEVLKQYDLENNLSSILAKHPLLTIYVPDWSWINEDCFSINRWNCSSPDVGTSYVSNNSEHEIYWNGKFAFTMTDGEFCSAPILIVKDNERLTENPDTKCPGASNYKFYCDDLIDLSSAANAETKTSSNYTYYDLPYAIASNTVSTKVLTKRTNTAYSINSNDNRVSQRDHVYYGMTPSINSGVVDPNYYETLYRIKLNPNSTFFFDNPITQNAGNDFSTCTYYYEASWGSAKKLTQDDIESMSWGKGSADLIINVYVGETVIKKNVTVGFSDAFSVKKIVLRENINWLGALKSRTYYLGIGTSGNNDEWLEPKWINANLQLFYWDLTKWPTSYIVEFEEYDKASKYTKTVEYTCSFATNFTSSSETGATIDGVSVKQGYGTGASSTKSQKITKTVETTEESDALGNFSVQYTDKIVLSQNSSVATPKTYSTGAVDVQILAIYE